MRLYKKVVSKALVLSMIMSCFSLGAAYAAAPSPKHDESMYVNLDYYGAIDETRIVKSYNVNGSKEIVDFGDYDKITNMSNFVKPQVNNGKVVFKLTDDISRFYFEAVPRKKQTVLPWTFDVAYKLNGVEKKAEELAGEKGLVEIKIKAVPNSKIEAYYKNNMLLQVATMIDMDENLSIEAPGAQLQSVGNKKAIMFMGLPGEENEFLIRVGSDDFEFPGFAIMIIPATLSQLDDLKDLRETKEKIEDSTDAMSASMDVILNTLESMQSSFDETAKGLRVVDGARETVSTSKAGVYEDADRTLVNLDDSARQLEKFIPHLEATEQLITDVNKQVNVIVDATKEVKYKLGKVQTILIDLNENLSELQDLVDELGDVNMGAKKRTVQKAVSSNITEFESLSTSLDEDVKTIKLAVNSLDEDLSASGIDSASITALSEAASDPRLDMILGGVGQIGDGLTSIGAMVGGLKSTAGQYSSDIISTMGNTKALNESVSELAELSKVVIDGIVDLNDIIDENEPVALQAVNDSQEMLGLAIESIGNVHSFLTESEALLKKSAGQLDEGTKKSINGLIDALEKSMAGLGQTTTLRNAKNTVKDLVDSEWDKYTEDENHMLNIDTQATMVSFTSKQNIEPESIQVILRTKEITRDEDEKSNVDLEKNAEKDKGTVISRIGDIFKKMASIVASALKPKG
ncbi:MAG: hypothetical protein WBH44_11505 [Proteocatella sp.]